MKTLTRLTKMTIAALAVLALLGGCGEQAIHEPTVAPEPENPLQATEDLGEPLQEAEPGKQAPDFTAPLAGGGEVSLSDYEGRIAVFDFWATWCAGCVEELPEYQEMYESWDHDKVGYLGMSLDDSVSTVEAFLEGHPELTLPMAVIDEETTDAYLAKRTLPSSRVLDADGVIRYEFTGPAADRVKRAVEALLAEQEAGSAEATDAGEGDGG
jgi:peroxiredoxin